MPFVIREPAAIKMVERERGDLFIVCLAARSLIVQMIGPLLDGDKAMNTAVPGEFAVTEGAPRELWLRIHTQDSFSRCQYLLQAAPCPACGCIMDAILGWFKCTECSTELK